MVDKAKALSTLEEIASDIVVDVHLHKYAIINLCELLLDEFRLYHQQDVLLEIEKYLEILYNITEKQKIPPLLIEVLIFQF